MRTGRPMLVPHLTDEMLAATSKSSEHLEGLRSLGFSSVMIAPLSSGKESIGCITFISSENKRQYDMSDLAVAVEIASRASLALQNAGLYQSAKEAIVLRDNFISMASHELKTPVTSLRIFTEVLQKQSKQAGDEATYAHLTKMDRQLSKLTDLIFNMLDISKMKDEHLELNRAVFDFDRMVREVVESLQYGTPSHTILVHDKSEVQVYGDEDRIAQVLVNLISNAIKYSPRAKRVVVTLARQKDRAVCSVQDFGIGIESAHLKRVFERFYRISDGIHRTYPGLGIGLYLSAEIVERHGGTIWVESEKGKGSTFYFSVPIAQ
jgi:signal transduction histidine kinase